MTVDTTGGGTVATYDPNDNWGDVGLEDVSTTDVAIPRLKIVHNDGVFEDSLSKAQFPKLTAILLGLVKQRIMWDDDVEDGDKPMCKSPNFEHGFPNTRDDVPADKRFPWARSNFEPAQAQPVEVPAGGPFPHGWSSNGLPVLPCAACVFKEWPAKGEKGGPPCAEQHTYPLLYTPDEGQSWQPALLTFQKTGIKPSRSYLSYFAQSKQPMFTVFTEISLTQQSRGSVKYSVPNLKRLDQTPREGWAEYADQYRNIREFVRSAPRAADEEGDSTSAGTTNVNTGPAPDATASAAATSPTPASAPTPPATTPPSPTPPAAAAPPAPAAPPAEAAPAAPAPAPAAPAAAPSTPPTAAPAAPAAATPAAPVEEELPF